tara:strand:+ start:17891 stop:19006 length:1116 start_codon:yes stop_codon:yes gene_type:complete
MKNVRKYDKNLFNDATLDSFDRKYQLDTMVNKILDTSGELPAAEYESLFNHLSEQRLSFIDGDKKSKALIIRDLNTKSQSLKAYKNFRQDLAAAYNQKQLMSGWVDSRQGSSVMNLLNDESRLVQKKCDDEINCPEKDELGVLLPDFTAVDSAEKRMREIDDIYREIGSDADENFAKEYLSSRKKLEKIINNDGERWVSITNLKNHIKLKDNSSISNIRTMGNNFLNKSSRILNEDHIGFNRAAAERQVRANILGQSTNKESLLNDEIIFGRVMKDDLLRDLSKKTPSALGLAKASENEKPIGDKMAQVIVDNMAGDPKFEKMLDEEIVKYYTNHLQKQWEMGIANRTTPAGDDKVSTKKESGNKYIPGSL